MGALVTARRWIRETFEPSSRPKLAQVIEWIERDAVPGKIIDGEPYVDADRFAVQSSKPTSAPRRSGLDLLQ